MLAATDNSNYNYNYDYDDSNEDDNGYGYYDDGRPHTTTTTTITTSRLLLLLRLQQTIEPLQVSDSSSERMRRYSHEHYSGAMISIQHYSHASTTQNSLMRHVMQADLTMIDDLWNRAVRRCMYVSISKPGPGSQPEMPGFEHWGAVPQTNPPEHPGSPCFEFHSAGSKSVGLGPTIVCAHVHGDLCPYTVYYTHDVIGFECTSKVLKPESRRVVEKGHLPLPHRRLRTSDMFKTSEVYLPWSVLSHWEGQEVRSLKKREWPQRASGAPPHPEVSGS